MARNIVLKLTKRQAEVLLKYGYPFESEQSQLEEFCKTDGPHYLKSCDFYLPRLSSDLVYSFKKGVSERVANEFDELWDLIDMALEQKNVHLF